MKPIVYIDSCCFGLAARQNTERNRSALRELRVLVFCIEQGIFDFVYSSWLHTELMKTLPSGNRRAVLAELPRPSQTPIPETQELRRQAAALQNATGLSFGDALHIASAKAGGANCLITFDKEFFEIARQNAKLLGLIRVFWLESCVPELYQWRPQKRN